MAHKAVCYHLSVPHPELTALDARGCTSRAGDVDERLRGEVFPLTMDAPAAAIVGRCWSEERRRRGICERGRRPAQGASWSRPQLQAQTYNDRHALTARHMSGKVMVAVH